MQTPLTYDDVVFVKIKGTAIIGRDVKNHDGEIPFIVIGYSIVDEYYILFVPKYYNIKNNWTIRESDLIDFNIHNKYKGKQAVVVKFDKITKVNCKSINQDGMFCAMCKIFCHMAQPNQSDDSFICYNCRHNPYR